MPLVESVRAMLGLGRSTPEEAHDIVVQCIRALAPELDVYRPILLHTLSIDSEAFPLPDYLTDDEFKPALSALTCRVFQAVGLEAF